MPALSPDAARNILDLFREDLEIALKDQIAALPPSRLAEAMAYSLLAPGKRVRPLLLCAALCAYKENPAAGLPAAAAVEMIHTYSLIHDDMPEMDNDDLRRGRPTCHKAFGADTALLAGDALQTLAFETLCKTPCTRAIPALVSLSAKMAGAAGMCYGQDLDLQASGQVSLAELETIETRKTGCLIALPLCMAAILAGHPEDVSHWLSIGQLIGIQFQIQDDLLEILSDPQTMGKSLSDARNEKATALSVFTLEEGQQKVAEYNDLILGALDELNLPDDSVLRYYLQVLLNRTC